MSVRGYCSGDWWGGTAASEYQWQSTRHLAVVLFGYAAMFIQFSLKIAHGVSFHGTVLVASIILLRLCRCELFVFPALHDFEKIVEAECKRF